MELICIPGNTILTVPGITSRLNTDQIYLIAQTKHQILQNGLVLNSCFSTPKARNIPVILINSTGQNIWVRKGLLTLEIFQPELQLQSYCIIMNRVKSEMKIKFQPVPP